MATMFGGSGVHDRDDVPGLREPAARAAPVSHGALADAATGQPISWDALMPAVVAASRAVAA